MRFIFVGLCSLRHVFYGIQLSYDAQVVSDESVQECWEGKQLHLRGLKTQPITSKP